MSVLGAQSLLLGFLLMLASPAALAWGGAALVGAGGVTALALAYRIRLAEAVEYARRAGQLAVQERATGRAARRSRSRPQPVAGMQAATLAFIRASITAAATARYCATWSAVNCPFAPANRSHAWTRPPACSSSEVADDLPYRRSSVGRDEEDQHPVGVTAL